MRNAANERGKKVKLEKQAGAERTIIVEQNILGVGGSNTSINTTTINTITEIKPTTTIKLAGNMTIKQQIVNFNNLSKKNTARP